MKPSQKGRASSPLNNFYRIDETQAVKFLLGQIQQTPEQSARISHQAGQLVEGVRAQKPNPLSLENFLAAYGLNSQEGLALMCLAEALLRIPDKATKTRLVRDKISALTTNNVPHSAEKSPFLAKLAHLGLTAAGQVMHWGKQEGQEANGFWDTLGGLARRAGEPVIRQILAQAMKLLGRQFVMGETIDDALSRAKKGEKEGCRHSYDMLGEAACTKADAARYAQAYARAITTIGETIDRQGISREGDIFAKPSISIKLSALHPRYELAQRKRVRQELTPVVLNLALLAKEHGIGLTIDAEESERLGLSLEIVEFISGHADLKGWDGFGLAVQAYQKRAPFLIDHLIEMARRHGRRLGVRLVKGAYWDSEIKRTQERGLKGYAVFTRKAFTDVSYQVCAQKMLGAPDAIYPQFATHNARTVAAILELAEGREFEFQRLHGMGEALYTQVGRHIPCRVYAPVGEYRDLLAYLVRRLLENGANTSFVHKVYDPFAPVESLVRDPLEEARLADPIPHPKIPLPVDMLRPSRQNSAGIDLNDEAEVQAYQQSREKKEYSWRSAPLIEGEEIRLGEPASRVNPARTDQVIGQAWEASSELADQAMAAASKAFEAWCATPVDHRAQALERFGDLLEQHREEFLALLVREGGKTLPDAVAEVREAVDFCWYYAAEARRIMETPLSLQGPTGEINQLSLQGRGVFVCISPWNFPLAIFTGQMAAALAAGNCVLAKPAHQTPLVAYRAVQLAHQAGIPASVLHYLPGKGSVLGEALMQDPRTAGVAFTGSTAVAQKIAQTLLSRAGAPLVPLIAETGGMNAMIVDSSALPEQVVRDILVSSFQSAGQRCSALRLLFVQDEVADSLLAMLAGAMGEMSVGDPSLLSTDVGPVIDQEACASLQAYEEQLQQSARLIYRGELDASHQGGHFFAPQGWEIAHAGQMTEEIFGPVLQVVRFKGGEIDHVVDQINATGYGLTLGVHSRIEETIQRVRKRARVGNLYVNRSMIGAVVGVQPFGGEGLSGTGPKAGGPHYLLRFTVERTFTQDTTASGGNASLLADLE